MAAYCGMYMPPRRSFGCCYRLFDRALPGWDPQYVTRPAPPPPAPQRRPATAAPKPAAARGEAAAATPAAATAPAGNTASATAADKVSKETLNSIKGPPDGGARATSTGRGTKEGADKEAKPHRASRDATSRNGSAAREGKESAARDGRDAKGKETSTRGGREHTDKGTREGSRATAATGKAADDKQLAEVRAAALKRQSSASGEAADGSRKASPAAQEEAAKGGKAALANGTAVAAGTKRRAPDSAPAETRYYRQQSHMPYLSFAASATCSCLICCHVQLLHPPNQGYQCTTESPHRKLPTTHASVIQCQTMHTVQSDVNPNHQSCVLV